MLSERVSFVIFDAKMKTYFKRRKYVKFLKELKGLGYIMLQKSVYVRYTEGSQPGSEKTRVGAIVPSSVEAVYFSVPKEVYDRMSFINCNKLRFMEEDQIICI